MRNQRKFSLEFKRQVVEEFLGGEGAAQLCRKSTSVPACMLSPTGRAMLSPTGRALKAKVNLTLICPPQDSVHNGYSLKHKLGNVGGELVYSPFICRVSELGG